MPQAASCKHAHLLSSHPAGAEAANAWQFPAATKQQEGKGEHKGKTNAAKPRTDSLLNAYHTPTLLSSAAVCLQRPSPRRTRARARARASTGASAGSCCRKLSLHLIVAEAADCRAVPAAPKPKEGKGKGEHKGEGKPEGKAAEPKAEKPKAEKAAKPPPAVRQLTCHAWKSEPALHCWLLAACSSARCGMQA